MDKISFLFDDTVVLATVSKISEHVIKFTCSETLPEESVLLSGFNILNENNGNNMTGDYYHEYTTVYKSIDSKIVLLSNDGSVYTEENDVDDSGSILEPTEPYVETLEEVKERKISELSNICQENIIAGVDVDIDGEIEHFSYKSEDQINIGVLFNLVYDTNCNVYYHADNDTCKEYTPEQIIAIYSAELINMMHNTTYFNQLKKYIDTLEEIDSVNNVMYGQELISEYLDVYNNAMAMAKYGLEKKLENRTSIIKVE